MTSASRHLLFVLGAMLWAQPPLPASAQAVSADWLRGRTITAQVVYETRARRNGREFDNPVKVDFTIRIDGEGKVSGTTTRHVVGPRGPASETRSYSAVLGKPRDARGGHSLMLLSGNTLTTLRTFEVGGNKTTITFRGGNSCTVRSPVMKEVGAGPMRRDAVVGGSIEILSSRQVSTSCQVQ